MGSRVFDKKVQEGEALQREGDKLITKTLFRWKPDHEAACTLYEKAGTSFRNGKAWGPAKESFKKAAVSFQQSGINFSAAHNLDLAGMMAKEQKQPEEAAELFEQASRLYREDSHPDKAAEELVKAAKAMEEVDVEQAVQYAEQACSLMQEDDRDQFAVGTFRYSIQLMLRTNRMEQAVQLLHKQATIHEKLGQPHDVHKLQLSIIVIHLASNDIVAAYKAYQDFLLVADFVGTQECGVAAELLEAFERNSPDDVAACISKQAFDFLDNQVVRLVKGLKVEAEDGGLA